MRSTRISNPGTRAVRQSKKNRRGLFFLLINSSNGNTHEKFVLVRDRLDPYHLDESMGMVYTGCFRGHKHT